MSVTQKQSIRVLDIINLLLSKWWIILISVAVCVTFFWIKYRLEEPRFYRSATIIIKDSSSRVTTGGLDRFDHSINKVNLSNEIRQFKSISVLTDVVNLLKADLHYLISGNLRDIELYNDSPIRIDRDTCLLFSNFTCKIRILDSIHGKFTEIKGIQNLKEGSIFRFGHPFIFGNGIVTINLSTDNFEYWRSKDIIVKKYNITDQVRKLISEISVVQDEEESSILTIKMIGSHPKFCEDFIITLINIYNYRSLLDKNQIVDNTAHFISERISILENELGNVENQLQNYRQDNEFFTIETAATYYLDENSTALHDVDKYNVRISWAREVKSVIKNKLDNRLLLPENTGLEIDNLSKQYNNLFQHRKELANHGGNSNPVNIKIDERLKETGDAILSEIESLILSMEVIRNEAADRMEETSTHLSTLPSYERELLAIKRQQKIKENLYIFLLNKREENALSRAMADDNARIIDEPHGPDDPITPNRNRLLTLGIIIGLVISIGALLLSKYMDNNIHTGQEIKSLISIPFVGEIPFEKNNSKNKTIHKSLKQTNYYTSSIIDEAMRLVRTNISFLSNCGKPYKVLTFTSFIAGAGKSFITLKYALSLATLNRKIVVVDLDIRKATLSHRLGFKGIGLSNYLSDPDLDENEIIINKHEFDFIPAGNLPPNPTELLMLNKLDELVENLRKKYDHIIIDNVPYGMIADAAITNRITDLTVFVLRAGKSNIQQLNELEHIYDKSTLKNICILLNSVIISHKHEYYY